MCSKTPFAISGDFSKNLPVFFNIGTSGSYSVIEIFPSVRFIAVFDIFPKPEPASRILFPGNTLFVIPRTLCSLSLPNEMIELTLS